MQLTPPLVALALALPLVPGSGAAAGGDDGPRVGQVAPPLALRSWLRTDGAPARELPALAGRVVVVHTFAWNCGSCLRVGLPLAADLQAANADELTVLSVTTPAAREETEEVLERFGIVHPVALESPFGAESPYVDMTRNSITYAWVIGRSGELVWRGDPSTDLDECLEAVRAALDDVGGRALGRPLHEELDDAVAAWFAADYREAREEAEKVHRRWSRSRRDEAPAVAADAALLLERLDALPDALLARMEAAREAGDGPAFLRVLDHLTRSDLGADASARAQALRDEAAADAAFAGRLAHADAWVALELERPPRFPSRRDRDGERFAKRVARYLEDEPGSPHAERARAWLERFADAPE